MPRAAGRPGVVVFDRDLIEGATYLVECSGRMVERFTSDVTRPATLAIAGTASFALHEVDPELVAQPPKAERASVAIEDTDEWRRASWSALTELPEGTYRVRYGDAEALLVLGPEEVE